MDRSSFDTNPERNESHDSVPERSSRDTSRSIAPDLSSMTDTSSIQRTAADSAVGPQSSGPDTRGQYQQRYGVDIETASQANRLQRLEASNTLSQVQRWADEGIPIEAMGTPSKMQAFRQRKGTPVPWDIERQNKQSAQRSKYDARDTSPAGQTQVPESVRDVVSTPGQPVDAALRKPVEAEIGQSLDHARVHRSPAADAACDQLNARAFTVDNHVAVRSDQPSPDTPAGQHLMSHELTHVAQQTGGAVSLLPDAGALEVDHDPQLEREAEKTAQRVMQGGKLGIQRLQDTDVHVQRMQPGGGSSRDMQPGGGPSSQQNIQANQGNGSARRQRVRELLENYGIGEIYWTQGSLAAADALLRNQRLRGELQSLGISVVPPSRQKVDRERTKRRQWRKDVLEYCGIGHISRTRGEEAAIRAVHRNPKLLNILRHLGLRIDPPNQGNVAAPPNQGNPAEDWYHENHLRPVKGPDGNDLLPPVKGPDGRLITDSEFRQLVNEVGARIHGINPPGQQNIQPNQGNVAAPPNQGNVAANEDQGWAQMLLDAAAVVDAAAARNASRPSKRRRHR